MKIALPCIFKDDIAHVENFIETARDFDEVVCVDTGSKDGTAVMLKEAGFKIFPYTQKHFRFDAARNEALSHLSPDVDLVMHNDLDETIDPGWRNKIELAFSLKPKATRARYIYFHSPTSRWTRDAIHRPKGYKFKYPCHEALVCDEPEFIIDIFGVIQHHHQDQRPRFSRNHPLLEIALVENPGDDRILFHAIAEFFKARMTERVMDLAAEFEHIPRSFPPYHATVLRFVAEIYAARQRNADRISVLKRAVKICPILREPLIDLADAYIDTGEIALAKDAIKKALRITDRPALSVCEARVWGEYPHELLRYCESV